MADYVGKILTQARLKRGLTLEEVAHATKLRPDLLAALEANEFSRFANNAYAKSFLNLYGRYLGVDVSEFARTLDTSLKVSVAEYQYLSNAPKPAPERIDVRRRRGPPSVLPLIAIAALIFFGFVGLWYYSNAQRIFKEPTSRPAPAPETAVQEAEPATVPAQTDLATLAAVPDIPPIPITLAPAEAPKFDLIPPAAPAVAERPSVKNPDASPASDRDFITPLPIPTTEPGAQVQPTTGVNEILVASVKKTLVTIRKDDPQAPPIFEDYLYPNAPPLKLKGTRFFIEARDPASVQITKNGLPFAYQAPGVPIQ